VAATSRPRLNREPVTSLPRTHTARRLRSILLLAAVLFLLAIAAPDTSGPRSSRARDPQLQDFGPLAYAAT
jgi:hypothetical protein